MSRVAVAPDDDSSSDDDLPPPAISIRQRHASVTDQGLIVDDDDFLALPEETWTRLQPTGWHPSAREAAGLAAVGGRVVLVGGLGGCGGAGSGGRTSEVAVFDEARRAWTRVRTSGDVLPARSGHTVSVVGDELWVFGGEGAYAGLNQRTVFGDLYALRVGSWECRRMPMVGAPPFGMAPPGRRGHTATVLPHAQSVLFYGGTGPDRVFGVDVYFDDLQELDVRSRSWRQIRYRGRGPGARARHTATLLPDLEAVFVFGGLTAAVVSTVAMPRLALLKGDRAKAQQERNRRTKRSTPHRQSPSPSSSSSDAPAAVASGTGFADDRLYRLDLAEHRWSVVSMTGQGPGCLQGHAAVFSEATPHKFYIFGGRGQRRPDACVFVADTTLSTWSSVEPPGDGPGPRYSHAAVANADGALLVFGGNSFSRYCNADVFSLRLNADQPPVWPPLLRRGSVAAPAAVAAAGGAPPATPVRAKKTLSRARSAPPRRRTPPRTPGGGDDDDPEDSMVFQAEFPSALGRPATPLSVFRRPQSSPVRRSIAAASFTLYGGDQLRAREAAAKHRARARSPPARGYSLRRQLSPPSLALSPARRLGSAPPASTGAARARARVQQQARTVRRPATTRGMLAMKAKQRTPKGRRAGPAWASD